MRLVGWVYLRFGCLVQAETLESGIRSEL